MKNTDTVDNKIKSYLHRANKVLNIKNEENLNSTQVLLLSLNVIQVAHMIQQEELKGNKDIGYHDVVGYLKSFIEENKK
jgi:hypothetical protein